MTKYKNKKKTLYFIMPTKQNGYPNLTAWTDNEFLAQGYAKQYQSLSPVILSCEGYDIKDPDVEKFTIDNMGCTLGESDRLFTETVTPFYDYGKNIVSSNHEIFLFTDDQQTSIGEQWSYTEYELYDMLCGSTVNMFYMSRFLVDDKFREIFGYIFSKYIIRLLLAFSGHCIEDLPIESREKLGLTTSGDYLCDDQIYNYSYMTMILIRKCSCILDGDEE